MSPNPSFGSGIPEDDDSERQPPLPPAAPGLPDLSSWGKTAPAPASIPDEHVFEPGDDIGNRADRPDPNQQPRPRRGGRGGRGGGDRRGNYQGPPRGNFQQGGQGGGGYQGGGDRRGGGFRERRPHIPGPPPPPTDLPGNPLVVPRPDHTVSRKNIDANAVQVLYRLHRSGHTAYLVGGGVRDLLLGLKPKDFDVGTDASPQQVKRLFPNCMIIGRRFKLCHVRSGYQIVEVATFRGKGTALEVDESKADHGQTPLDENVFGTAQEDALRRDFTINGLFYDIGTFALIDYVGGLEDLKNKLLRTIGDPAERFREDPVRMVRAVKFAARLGFTFEENTRAAFEACKGAISAANPSRMLEEWYRLLNRGFAEKSIALMRETGLLAQLLPSLDGEDAAASRRWLAALDGFEENFRPLPNALALAGLFGPRIEKALALEGTQAEEALHGVWASLEEDLKRLQVSRKDRGILMRMLLSQWHFAAEPDAKFAARGHFPAAVDFFELAGRAMGKDLASLPAWRKLEAEVPRQRVEQEMLPGDEGGEPRRRRRRRRSRGGSRGGQGEAGAKTMAAGASAGPDLEQGPPPGATEALYEADKEDGPGWMSEETPA